MLLKHCINNIQEFIQAPA